MKIEQPLGVEESVTPTEPGQTKAPEETVDTTKAFAARLAQERLKISKTEREKIAKENGYATYEEFQEANLTTKVRQNTIYDPNEPDFKKLIKIIGEQGDPEKETLKAEVEAYRALEVKRWNDEQVKALNETYGVKLKSLDELDDEVKKKISKGIDPVDAYYLIHKPKTVVNPKDPKEQEHLVPDPGASGNAGDTKEPTPEEIKKVKAFLQNDDLTDDQIKELIKKSTG